MFCAFGECNETKMCNCKDWLFDATTVDTHTYSRYSSLTAALLLLFYNAILEYCYIQFVRFSHGFQVRCKVSMTSCATTVATCDPLVGTIYCDFASHIVKIFIALNAKDATLY